FSGRRHGDPLIRAAPSSHRPPRHSDRSPDIVGTQPRNLFKSFIAGRPYPGRHVNTVLNIR
ncbi:MAG TPA: hypothetical protein VJJ98_05595, partial [Sedimentisphaerales bacterium]|nr:hypothetical protein [Sedimentisphaerales bacterium]